MVEGIHERTVEVWASPRSFSKAARTALGVLGYRLVAAEGDPTAGADVRVVSDGLLDRLASESALELPLVLLTGPRERPLPEVHRQSLVGVVRRPAGLRDLYRLLQEALEEHPRAVPRVGTSLPARFVLGTTGAPGAIVSLSENGCLLRTPETWRDGRARVWFALPGRGLVDVAARPIHRRTLHVGLAFHDLPDPTRHAIAHFVETRLTT